MKKFLTENYYFRWVQINDDKSTEKYRERKEDSDDDEEQDIKPIIKSERLSPCEDLNKSQDSITVKPILGLNLFFNMEAGNVLPLAIKLVELSFFLC